MDWNGEEFEEGDVAARTFNIGLSGPRGTFDQQQKKQDEEKKKSRAQDKVLLKT